MIKITRVTLRNFLSIGNSTQVIDFQNEGLTLVLGKNIDAKEGMDRNGAGKTTILQALAFGLYGKPLTKIKIPNLINDRNMKQMVVTVEFERDGVSYRVERGQKPAFLRFFVDQNTDNERNEAQGENKYTQEEITQLIGMSHTMFRHVVAMSTFTEPFPKMSAAEQRDAIEELLGVTLLSERGDALKKKIAETKEILRNEEAAIRATTEANARINHTISQTRANSLAWDRQRAAKIQELEESIAALAEMDFDAEIAVFDRLDDYVGKERVITNRLAIEKQIVSQKQSEIASLAAEVASYEREVSKIDPQAQIARLEAEITRKRRDMQRHADLSEKLKLELAEAKALVGRASDQVCSCCDQPLKGTDHLAKVMRNMELKCESIAARIAEEEMEATDRLNEIGPVEASISVVERNAARQIEELGAKIEARTAAVAEKRAEQAQHALAVEEATTALAALGERPRGLFDSRDEVYRTKQMRDILVRDLEQEVARENPNIGQIAMLEATLQVIDQEKLNSIQTLFKHQEMVQKLLTSKDSFIRKRIIDQNLSKLNARINHYVDKLGLPHEIIFMSDMSLIIDKMGKDYDFEQLSRGEQNRVVMALSWAFRDVWEGLNHSINLVFVDEMIDSGMDDSGSEVALNILQRMGQDGGKNVFLISHKESLVGRVSQVLTVYKENEFTTYEMTTG